jgi:hypothetical protein
MLFVLAGEITICRFCSRLQGFETWRHLAGWWRSPCGADRAGRVHCARCTASSVSQMFALYCPLDIAVAACAELPVSGVPYVERPI